MPICLIDWLGRFPQVVELAELMGDTRQHPLDRPADGMLAIGDDATDRHRHGILHLLHQGRQIVGRRTQEAASQEHLA